MEYEKKYRRSRLEESVQYMIQAKKQIEEKLKDAEMAEPNPYFVHQTIKKFFRWAVNPLTEDFNWFEVASLCRGLSVETSEFGSLMASENAIKVLLRKFSMSHSQMLSAYPWQGLLNAYLNVSSRQNPRIEENWRELQTFLDNSLDQVANQAGFKPRWLEALVSHRIVLAENATWSLAEEALQGRMDRVERIAREINIPATSWFWLELLMSQVEKIITYRDDKFKSGIDLIMPQLQKRRECLDDGLARILDRYAQCINSEPHQGLKSIAVSRWKSPSLETQRDWERVSLEAKRMMQRWLVVEDLNDFFFRLRQVSDDASLDRRRFEFWMQYLNQISYSFLILGPDTQANFQQLLADKPGRYSALTGTNRANNAFMIRLGKHYIVEFGGVGKTWAYDESKIRPLLNHRSINYDELRAPERSSFQGYDENEEGGLAHRGAWEEKFHRALDYLGIAPDTMTLDDFLARYQIKNEKAPSGTLWARHFYADGVIAAFLRKHGFVFKSATDGFYLNPRNTANY